MPDELESGDLYAALAIEDHPTFSIRYDPSLKGFPIPTTDQFNQPVLFPQEKLSAVEIYSSTPDSIGLHMEPPIPIWETFQPHELGHMDGKRFVILLDQ
jgi:hypothetical protein